MSVPELADIMFERATPAQRAELVAFATYVGPPPREIAMRRKTPSDYSAETRASLLDLFQIYDTDGEARSGVEGVGERRAAEPRRAACRASTAPWAERERPLTPRSLAPRARARARARPRRLWLHLARRDGGGAPGRV